MTRHLGPKRAAVARRFGLGIVAGLLCLAVGSGTRPPVGAQSRYVPITGEGSSWAGIAIDDMRVNVAQFGITVNYARSGSTTGRKNFLNDTVDFAASDIPFQFRPEDGSAPDEPVPGSYVYIPVTAGGTAFMYNLKINGKLVTNLRLSGENVAKIFTGVITTWNDPAIQADNPGLVMPARQIVPTVRSDGSGSTAQFTKWMINQHSAIWQAYCERSGRAPACGFTSQYPTVPGMKAFAGDDGVSGNIQNNSAEGSIGYVNYSYALNVGFPVAKVLNAAGYYTEPTPENVSVSLLKARINDDSSSEEYLTAQLDGVYSDTDPRNYQLSSYSYFILRTKVTDQFDLDKGYTLGEFAYYAMCEAQQRSISLGYSPLPINLVEGSLDQIRKVPGVVPENVNIAACKNPTFSPDGTNVLAANAPQPQDCDKIGAVQCATGTGGNKAPTAVAAVGPVAGGGTTAVDGAPAGGATPAGGAGTGATASSSTGGVGGASGAGTTGAGGTGTSATAAAGTPGAATTATGDPTLGPTAAGGDPSLAGVVEVCDADTGVCSASSAASGASGAAAAAAIGSVLPTTLEQDGGWGAAQTLLVVVVLCTLALVLIPAFAWRQLAQKESA
jgi:phosphate ABC transporter phosphate-binding protein